MQDLSRLKRFSTTLYWIALAVSVSLPILVLAYAAKGVGDTAWLLSFVPTLAEGQAVSRVQAGLVAAVALVSVLPMIAALRAMARLFDRYRDGEVLTATNAETILQIGRALVLVAVFTVLVPTLTILILSWNSPQRQLSIGLDGSTLGFFLVAGLLTVIGWAMREAARVKAEHEAFV